MLPLAIQCLEDELARMLARVDAVTRELNELRRMHAVPLVAPRDPYADLPPEVSRPRLRTVSESTPSTAPASVPVPGGAGTDESRPAEPEPSRTARLVSVSAVTPAEPQSPAGPPARPGGPATPPEHECAHCPKSFDTRQGLSLHITRVHPIERRPFDPDKARAGAAAAI
jgi:hypothetical protein